MKILHRCCCGLDVHEEQMLGCVIKAEEGG